MFTRRCCRGFETVLEVDMRT